MSEPNRNDRARAIPGSLSTLSRAGAGDGEHPPLAPILPPAPDLTADAEGARLREYHERRGRSAPGRI